MSEVAKGKLHSVLKLEVSKTIYQTLESQILGLRTMVVIFGLWMSGFHFLTNSIGSFPSHMI